MLYLCRYSFVPPIGCLEITTNGQAITSIALLSPGALPSTSQETALHREAAAQLRAYFSGQLKQFDLPLDPQGTPFQLRVWNALCQIPYGQVCCYRDIAAAIGSPKACQAVGQANARNPIPFCIPCHRVIAADGGLGGYSLGLDKKQFLLSLERGA